MSGWICSHRSIWEHPIFKGSALRVGVWDWMLKTAAYKPTKFTCGPHVITLERGQLCVSQAQITEATGMTRQQVRTFLKALELDGSIQPQPNPKVTKGRTLITICNYDKYQDANQASNQVATKQQPTKKQITNKQSSSNEEHIAREAVDIWNDAASQHGWPTVQKITKPRISAIRQRIKECGGIDGWRHAVERCGQSDFLSNSSWFGFDWIAKPANFTKLMEGNYDNRTPNHPTRNARASRGHDSLFAGFAASADHEPDRGGQGFADCEPPHHASNPEMDCGPCGYGSQPVLRVIGSS